APPGCFLSWDWEKTSQVSPQRVREIFSKSFGPTRWEKKNTVTPSFISATKRSKAWKPSGIGQATNRTASEKNRCHGLKLLRPYFPASNSRKNSPIGKNCPRAILTLRGCSGRNPASKKPKRCPA